MRKTLKRIGTYFYILRTSFRQRVVYRASLWIEIVHGCFFLLLQGCLWTALIAAGQEDTMIDEMITYVVINDLVGRLVSFQTNKILSARVLDGSIASDMITPILFKWKVFFENIGENLFDFLFSGGSTLLIALLFFGVRAPDSVLVSVVFAVSVCIGILISYHIHFLFGLSSFWLVRPWYLSALMGAFNKLFGGMVIPIWMYPGWLQGICGWLPFQYVTFIPIQIYLGRLSGAEIYHSLCIQLLILVGLSLCTTIIWNFAQKKVFINGG